MKLKHWAGYGSVDVKKVEDKSCTLHLVITGDHEQGLERDNLYDLFNWLIKRFDKKLKDVSEIDWERRTKRMTEYGYEDYVPPRFDFEYETDTKAHYKFWY